MLLPWAVVVALLGGCAREEGPVPEEAPKGAGVGAGTMDPEQVALDEELGQAERWRKEGDAVKEVEFLLKAGARQIRSGRKEDALGTFERALFRSQGTGNRSGQAEALLNVGWLLIEKNELEEARKVLEEGLRMSEQLGDSGRQAKILHLLGNAYSKLGRYVEALSSYEKSLDFARTAGEEGLAADVWNAMGIVYGYRGEIEEAQRCYEKALILAPKAPRVTEAAIRSSLGWVQRRRGELNQALGNLTRALEINRSENDKRGTAAVLNLLGGVYLDLGENEKAREKYEESLGVHRSLGNSDGIGWALCNIGLVHLAEGKTREALERFEEAREPGQQGEQPRLKAAVLHGIGTARLELGRTEEAIQALEEALPLRRVGGDRRGEAATRLALGDAYQAQGELDRAASFMREALELAREAEVSFVQAASLFALARLDRDRGRLEEARTQIEEAIGILESIRADLRGDRLKSSFFASKRSYYDFYIDLLMRLERRHPGRGHAAEALRASERARARSLLDLLAEGRHEVTRGIDPALRRKESETAAWLSQIQGELIEELSKENRKERIETLRGRQTRAEEAMQELEREIRAKHPRYAEVRYPSPLDLEAIQKRLDSGTALLEYALGEDVSYLFLVTEGGLEVRKLPRTREIENHVRRVRSGVKAPGRLGGYIGSAHWLHEKLIAPVRSELKGKRLLLIVPDGPLHVLSFDALLTGTKSGGDASGLPYLIRDFAVGYAPSMSILSLLTRPEGLQSVDRKGALKLVAFADPMYGPEKKGTSDPGELTRGGGERTALDGLSRVRRLKGSDMEVRRIADRYRPGEVRIYRGEEANEGNVKDNRLVASADRLHFATHGFVDEERPALSALRLTRTRDDDGLLQVHEIFNLNLEADLVVLSACETGLGEQVTGEGLIGLTRAFLYAGSPSVVVSLWRVSDDKAPDLMADFYQGLDRLGDKAEALRQAKLAMIGKRESAHPYFWAPFILVGSPE